MSASEAVSNLLDHSEQPEQDGLKILHHLMDRFGWAGTIITRDDATDIAERDLTDEEWEAVRTSKPWRDMGSIWLEIGGWEPVNVALEVAGIEITEGGE